jgi:hypothetical protein
VTTAKREPSGSEPPRTRTWNLEIKSLKWRVPARTDASANYTVLQVFCGFVGMRVSIVYAPVPARLQYGCSNFLALRGQCIYNKSAVHWIR